MSDGKLAEVAEQLGKMVEHPKSKSTQPRFASRCPGHQNELHADEDTEGVIKEEGEEEEDKTKVGVAYTTNGWESTRKAEAFAVRAAARGPELTALNTQSYKVRDCNCREGEIVRPRLRERAPCGQRQLSAGSRLQGPYLFIMPVNHAYKDELDSELHILLVLSKFLFWFSFIYGYVHL